MLQSNTTRKYLLTQLLPKKRTMKEKGSVAK
jgi:hypothetical protein